MIPAKKPNATRNIATTEIENDRLRKSPSGTIGSAARDSTKRKIRPNTSPTMISPPTFGSVHSPVCLFESPMRNGAIAAVNTAAPM